MKTTYYGQMHINNIVIVKQQQRQENIGFDTIVENISIFFIIRTITFYFNFLFISLSHILSTQFSFKDYIKVNSI